jgi:hypothetical protein
MMMMVIEHETMLESFVFVDNTKTCRFLKSVDGDLNTYILINSFRHLWDMCSNSSALQCSAHHCVLAWEGTLCVTKNGMILCLTSLNYLLGIVHSHLTLISHTCEYRFRHFTIIYLLYAVINFQFVDDLLSHSSFIFHTFLEGIKFVPILIFISLQPNKTTYLCLCLPACMHVFLTIIHLKMCIIIFIL